jgi:hypothetical protein
MHLLAILFFAGVLGACVALLWSVVQEHEALILANLPWKPRLPAPTILAIRRVRYCATPSSISETPVLARIVSPAMVR